MDKNTEKIMRRLCRGGYTEGVWLCSRALCKDKPTAVITPNAEMLARAAKRVGLASLLRGGDILFPDGAGVFYAMERMGLVPAERSCGIELCQRLLESLSLRGKGVRVFLLGGGAGVAEAAARHLQNEYRAVSVCGTHHGFFDVGGRENDAVIGRINESRAQLLLVCMGFPRQEKWMLENRHRLTEVRLMMGLGGSLDVWSGNIPRAPKPLRDAGLEWAYRAVKDPRRIARLPALAEFAVDVAASKRLKM